MPDERGHVTVGPLCDWCALLATKVGHGRACAPQEKIAKTSPDQTSGPGEQLLPRANRQFHLSTLLVPSVRESFDPPVSHCLFFKGILFPRSLLISRQRGRFSFTLFIRVNFIIPPSPVFLQQYPVADPTFLLQDLERTNEVYSSSAMPFSPPDDVGILAMGIYFPNQVPFHTPNLIICEANCRLSMWNSLNSRSLTA